jgi:UDP:flavonoid glycosyltransferase YjiC (YdhE family)
MAENGARVGWAGVGLALPWRLLGRGSLRVAVRRILSDGSFRARSREIAQWDAAHDGPAVGAELVEEFAARSQ